MPWSEIEVYEKVMSRTEPGPGASVTDKGNPSSALPKFKSIPNVSNARLLTARLTLHDLLHTPEGLHSHEDTRRSLINAGLRLKAIQHELALRGYRTNNGCDRCREV